MADIIMAQRLTEILKALDKMHNGLLALIDEHHALVARVEELEKAAGKRDD